MAVMGIGAGLFLAVSLVCLARWWKSGGARAGREILFHPYTLATLLVFFSAFISLLVAQVYPPLGRPVGGFLELKKFHYFLYPPLVALAFLQTSDEVENHPFWKVWGGVGCVCALLAVSQYFGADFFPAPWLQGRFFRPIGETGRFHGQGLMFFHLSFASCLSFVAAAGLARLLWPLAWDHGRKKAFWALVALAGFLAVYFSFSRIGLVALAVIGIALAYLKKPLWSLVAVVVFMAVGALVWEQSSSLRDRFELNGVSNQYRETLWRSAWEMFRDRPLTGFGFGRSADYTPYYAEKILGKKPEFTSHAHDNILDTLAATGLFGFAAYCLWWLVLLAAAWRSFRSGERKWLPAAAIAALLAFQVNGLTQVNFWDGKSQHTLMLWAGVILALDLRRRREEATAFRR
jgi:O-antigen ligase